MSYRLLSPDGFDTSPNGRTYRNLKEVETELKRFGERYREQGYYSQTCYNGYIRHIPLNELRDYCEVIKI